MKFKTLNGKFRNISVTKYRIDWNKQSRSKFQKEVKDFLRPFWFHNSCYEEFPVAGTRLTIDIVNLSRNIAIEVQGMQHIKKTKFFHNKTFKFSDQIMRDEDKRVWCELNGFKLVEIYPNDKLSKEFFKNEFNIVL